MIESRYWKQDLLSLAKKLNSKNTYWKFTEKWMVLFEKELIIAFFIIRRLFESNKLGKKSLEHKVSIFYSKSNWKLITKMNQTAVDNIYNIIEEKGCKKDIFYLTNQLIHSSTIFAYTNKNKKWDGIYVCSDYERNSKIYRIPVSEITKILEITGQDYPCKITMKWDNKVKDYKIKVK